MTNKSIFLLASERSGTNFLRAKLNQCQKTVFAPEPVHLLNSLYYWEPYYGDLTNDGNFKKLVNDSLKLCYEHFSPWEVVINIDEVDKELNSDRNLISIVHFLFNRYAKFKGCTGYFCKENYFHNFIFQVDLQIPGAKYIYLYRDPRDYVLSNINRKFFYSDLKSIAERWAREQSISIRLTADQRLKNRILMLSYEDLITNESYWLNKICEFACLEKEDNKCLDLRNKSKTLIEDWKNIYESTLTNNYNKYLDKLSRRQINIIEHLCWKEMLYLGYNPVNSIKPSPGSFAFCIDRKYFTLKNILKKQKVKNSEEYHLRKKREAAKADIFNKLEVEANK